MEANTIKSLVQEVGINQGFNSKYTNISFEEVLLQAFEEMGSKEQAPSGELNKNEPLEGQYIYTFPLVATPIYQAGVKGSQIISEADLLTGDIPNSKAFEETFQDIKNGPSLIIPLESLERTNIQIYGFYHYEKPIVEYEKPVSETSVKLQEGTTKAY